MPPFKDITLSADLSVLVFPRTELTIGDAYEIQKPANQRALTGFDNTDLNVLYEFFENDKHELITSVGLTWEIGVPVERRQVPVLSARLLRLYFGKGFGDLPDSLPLLRPFALTGTAYTTVHPRAEGPDVYFINHSPFAYVISPSGKLQLRYLFDQLRDREKVAADIEKLLAGT